MKKIIALGLIFGSLPTIADVVRSPIHSLERVNNNYLVKFENGRVAFLSANDKSLGVYNLNGLKGRMVEAKLARDYSLLSIQPVEERPEGSGQRSRPGQPDRHRHHRAPQDGQLLGVRPALL